MDEIIIEEKKYNIITDKNNKMELYLKYINNEEYLRRKFKNLMLHFYIFISYDKDEFFKVIDGKLKQ